MASFTSNIYFAERSVEDALRFIIIFLQIGRMAIRAHGIPALATPRPINPFIVFNIQIWLQVKPFIFFRIPCA